MPKDDHEAQRRMYDAGLRPHERNLAGTADMMFPVRCLRCHSGVYDLAKVEFTARYTDCSVWKTPCCGQTVDDRGETGWTTRKDYKRIDTAAPEGPDVFGRWPS